MNPVNESPEDLSVQKLLEEVRRTLRENQLFIQKLKDEDADLDEADEDAEEMQDPEEFEEL